MEKITIDLMKRKDNIYLGTMRIEPELNMIAGYYMEKPVVSEKALRKIIEDKRPTLKNVNYSLFSCNDKFFINYDTDLL